MSQLTLEQAIATTQLMRNVTQAMPILPVSAPKAGFRSPTIMTTRPSPAETWSAPDSSA